MGKDLHRGLSRETALPSVLPHVLSDVFSVGRDPSNTASPRAGRTRAVLYPFVAAGVERLRGSNLAAPTVVFGYGNSLQVGGINAGPDTAEVVNSVTVRDGANKQFIGHPVGGLRLAFPIPELAITVRGGSAAPEPTGRGLDDLCPEATFESMAGIPGRRLASSLPAIVLQTQTLGNKVSPTPINSALHGRSVTCGTIPCQGAK